MMELVFNDAHELPEVQIVLQEAKIIIKPVTTLIQLRRTMTTLKNICVEYKINELVITEDNDKALKFYDDIHMNDLTKGMSKIYILKKNVKNVSDKMKQKLIIDDYHTLPTAGHAGIDRTWKTIKQRYFWINMKKDIEKFLKTCELCQKNKMINQRKTPMTVTTTASSAF